MNIKLTEKTLQSLTFSELPQISCCPSISYILVTIFRNSICVFCACPALNRCSKAVKIKFPDLGKIPFLVEIPLMELALHITPTIIQPQDEQICDNETESKAQHLCDRINNPLNLAD